MSTNALRRKLGLPEDETLLHPEGPASYMPPPRQPLPGVQTPAPEVDAELDEAQEAARTRRFAALLARAGGVAGAAIAGIRPDERGYAALEEGANAPVDEVLSRRKALLEKVRAGREGESHRLGLEDRTRGIERQGRLDAQEVERYGAAQAYRKERDIIGDKQEATRLAHNAALLREQRKLREEAKKDAVNLRSQHFDQKRADMIAERQVAGFSFAPGRLPGNEAAKKMQALAASRDRMLRLVDELDGIYTNKGTELVGDGAGRMGQLITAIDLEAKNIGELGALSGPDMGIVEKIRGADPTSWGQNVKGIFGTDNVRSALDGLRDWTRGSVESSAQAYGYTPGAGAPAASGGPFSLEQNASPAQPRSARDPKTGEVLPVDSEEEAAMFHSMGWEVQ